jgi:ankyrin repeat protein
MAGFVYIMSNPAFANLIKIGKSKKDPTIDRVSELNQTGVPEPFKVEYYAFVGDDDGLESFLHSKFSQYRPNPKREFFAVSIPKGVSAIQKHSEKFGGLKYEEIYFSGEVSRCNLWDEDWWGGMPSMGEVSVEIAKSEGISVYDEFGKTPIIYALTVPAEEGEAAQDYINKPEVISLLLRNGADPNAVDKSKREFLSSSEEPSALLLAVEWSQPEEVLSALLGAGADINYQDANGWTVLHYAYDDEVVTKFFIKNGVDQNIKNKEGQTALHMACEWAVLPNIKLLLQHGADINCIDNDGRNSLFYALEGRQEKQLQIMRFLVDNGADFMARDIQGNTLLHELIYCVLSSPDIADFLVNLGVDPNIKNHVGHTAIDLAKEKSYLITSKALLALV